VCKLFLLSITYLKCYKYVIKIIFIIFLENTIYWLTNICVAAKQENFILINYYDDKHTISICFILET